MAKRTLRLDPMPGRPWLLDLYSGAGGSAMGFYQAGFNLIGVDVRPMPNYPFEHVQGDALALLADVLARGMRLADGRRIAAVNASPPCQKYSRMTNCRPGLADEYPDLVGPTRDLLAQTGVPWVMENVVGAPLVEPITLCGAMFGLELYRHRLFESNVRLVQPLHPTHTKPASRAAHWVEGTIMSISGHVHPIELAREVMEIDWCNRKELGEAIPPAMTRYVGPYLLRHTG